MYQAGIYCRVSVEEQGREGEYSGSIHSQLQMARDYIGEQNGIEERKVYVDDGASGSNFERAQFRRMLADMELGVINMVIFKDISRLGREHIETGYYLERYFPEKQIRVVSILDNYDSAAGACNEMLEIRNLLNDMYLRDTSEKIRAAIQMKRRMGEYTPAQPPFGYVKSSGIHNHLEVDPYAAGVVRRIYRMYQNGAGCTVICRILNEEGIPCPAKYKKEVLKEGCVRDEGKGVWTASAVSRILKNPVYTGAVVIRKHERPSYKLKYRRAVPLEEMELAPDAHRAVISREEFDLVQQMRKDRGTPWHQKRGRNYCEQNPITFEKLDELVGSAVGGQLKEMETDGKWPEGRTKPKKPEPDRKTARLQAKIERNLEYRKQAYEQFMEGKFSKEEYLELKRMYEDENRKYQKQLTREAPAELVEKIYVYPDQKTDTDFRFASEAGTTDRILEKGGR